MPMIFSLAFLLPILLSQLLSIAFARPAPTGDENAPTESVADTGTTKYGVYTRPTDSDTALLEPNREMKFTINEEFTNNFGRIFHGFEECTDKQKRFIIKSFEEAGDIVGQAVITPPQFSINWQRPAVFEFLGGTARGYKYRETVKGNLGRVSWLYNPRSSARTTLTVKCGEADQLCKENPNALAFLSRPVGSTDPNLESVTFCPLFFRYPLLSEFLDSEPAYSLSLAPWREITPNTIIHEMMHSMQIGRTHPDFLNYTSREGLGIEDVKIKLKDHDGNFVGELQTVYGPQLCRTLAYGDEYDAYLPNGNADTYSMYLLAEYLQRNLGVYPYAEGWLDRTTKHTRGTNSLGYRYARPSEGAIEALGWQGTVDELGAEFCKGSNGTVGLVDKEKSVMDLDRCKELLSSEGLEYGFTQASEIMEPEVPFGKGLAGAAMKGNGLGGVDGVAS